MNVTQILNNSVIKNLSKMVGFGFLSLLIGGIQFYIPDVQGGMSDLREVIIIISVFFFPNWIYLIGVCFITSFATPPDGSFITTLVMHITASVFAWYAFNYLKSKTTNSFYLGIIWAFIVLIYYTIFLIPSMVIMNYLVDFIERIEIVSKYKAILFAFRFEMVATTGITSLFVASFQMTKDLKQKNLQLKTAKEKAEESDRLKSAFLNNLSHEIRTPLNAIVGFSRLMDKDIYPTKEKEKFVSIIEENNDHLLKLFDDLFTISKLDSGEQFVHPTWTKAEILFKEVTEIIKKEEALFGNKNIEVGLEISSELNNVNIYLDINYFKEILSILVQNALKFTSKGSVDVNIDFIDNSISLRVKDTGIGIAKEHQKNIFNRFYKLEQEDNFHKGLGLGLCMLKDIVRQTNGKIELDSKENIGSTFTITIPTQIKSI